MSLKPTDILRLSRASLAGHKSRNRLVVLLMVALFCPVFIFSMIFQGLENSIIRTSAQSTGGAVYIQTGLAEDYYNKDRGRRASRPAPDNAEEIIQERVKDYHGEIIGRISDVGSQQEWQYNLISQSALKDFEQQNRENGKVAAIKSENNPGTPSDNFQILATYPSTSGNLKTTNFLFDPILSQIQPAPKKTFIIDDGSDEFQAYLARENAVWREAHDYDYDPEPTMLAVAKFNNPLDAMYYYANTVADGPKYGYNLSSGYQYVVKDLFNNTISVAMSFTFYQMLLLILGLLFAIFAIWITVLTFSHIADEDVATTALYRAMGARSLDIYLIYGVYLLMLCIVSLAICLVLTLSAAGIIALFSSANHLSLALQSFYCLSSPPPVGFLAINSSVVAAALALLLTAPITLLFTGKKFSAKQIAHKLKEG